MLRGKQRVPLDLRRLDLLKQQFEPIEFTADLLGRPDCGYRQTGIEGNGSPPSDLELEITESVFLGDIEETVRTLFELKSMGVAISLDDFGTGYSSLTYLRRLPIDQLKIDVSFIRDLSADPNAAVLLSQIIQLGHAMHLEVVAEGVETEKEYAFPGQGGRWLRPGSPYNLSDDQAEYQLRSVNSPGFGN